jgi:hypothetical protein
MFRRIVALTAGAILAATLGLAMASPAGATTLPLPACSTVDPGVAPNFVNAGHCWYLNTTPGGGGASGYLGADDFHTRYRFVQTTFPVTPQLINLNGVGINGAAGVEECDPNIAYAAQFGVVWDTADGGKWVPFYAQGFWSGTAGDPCINHQPLVPNPTIATCPVNGNGGSVTGTSPAVFCGSFAPVATNDVLSNVGIFYTPSGFFFHHVSFGFCDVTQGYCRQAYAPHTVSLNFWEIGAGVFSGNQLLGAPANISLVPFSSTGMNCYSCAAGPRPLSVIQPVNDTGTGGLEEVADDNTSGQVVLGPDNSLTGGSFTMFNGSTS